MFIEQVQKFPVLNYWLTLGCGLSSLAKRSPRVPFPGWSFSWKTSRFCSRDVQVCTSYIVQAQRRVLDGTVPHGGFPGLCRGRCSHVGGRKQLFHQAHHWPCSVCRHLTAQKWDCLKHNPCLNRCWLRAATPADQYSRPQCKECCMGSGEKAPRIFC